MLDPAGSIFIYRRNDDEEAFSVTGSLVFVAKETLSKNDSIAR